MTDASEVGDAPAGHSDADDGSALHRNAAPHSLSVERVCRLLELFSAEQPTLTLAEIVALLGWSKATAHRYLMALRETSFLRYDDAYAEYRVGPKALSLAAAASAGLPLISLANPHMAQLARATNVTTLLTVLGDEAPVVIAMHDNTGFLVSIHVPVGTRLPLERSGHGDIYLAFEPSLEHRRQALADDTALQTRLAHVRRLGVATNDDLVTGVRGVVAPLFAGDRLVGALGLLGTAAMVPSDPNSNLTAQLRDVSARLTAELSGSALPRRHRPV